MRKFILGFVICSVMANQCSVFAAELNNPVFNRDTQMIIISGKAEKNSDVTVETLRCGNVEITDDVLTDDSIVYIKQIQANEDGCYSVSFPAKYGTGQYKVRVYAAADDEYFENDDLFVFSELDINELIDKIAAIDNLDDIHIIIDENTVKILGLDVSKITDMDAAALNELYVCLLNEKRESAQTANVDDIQNLVDAAYLLYTINNVGGNESLKGIVEGNEDILKLDASCSMELYSNTNIYDDKRKNNMLSKLAEKKYSTLKEFKKIFGEQTLLYSLYAQSSYHTIETILEQSHIIKQYDLPKYNALKDKTSVLKNINACKEPFKTVQELVSAIENWSNGGNSQGGGGTGHTSGGGGSYTSSGGKTVVSVPSATEKPSDIKHEYFNDISDFEWASTAIYYLRNKGIIAGREENSFFPGDNITREEFLKLLVKVSDALPAEAAINFKDVDHNDWYYGFVSAGVSMGIVKGKNDNIFGIGEFITREDMAVMAGRLIEYLQIDLPYGESVFKDYDNISEYAKEYVSRLCKNGIVNGVGDNEFAPKLYLNRASAAKIVYEIDKLIQENKKGR